MCCLNVLLNLLCCIAGPQSAYRGKLARRAVFHTLVVPRMLEAGLRRKRQIEASRWVVRVGEAQ